MRDLRRARKVKHVAKRNRDIEKNVIKNYPDT